MKKRWFVFIIILSLLVIGFAIGLNNVDNKGLLKVTNEHPFLVNNEWIKASELKVGDELFNINGKKVRITGIKDVNDEVEVYNLEAGIYNDFVVEDGIVVHNSNKPVESLEYFGKTVETDSNGNLFIRNSEGNEIPLPSEKTLPRFDKDAAYQWADSLEDPQAKVAARKLVDNVQYISMEEFQKDLGDAVAKFNEAIGDEPYVVVFLKPGKSHQWVYDLASDELKNKPAGFVFLSNNEHALDGYFDKGIKKFVIFDDASYTGTQLSTGEFGGRIPREYQSYIKNAGNAFVSPEGIEYIAVTGASTDIAISEFGYNLNNIFDKEGPGRVKSSLIRGKKIKTLGEVLDKSEYNSLKKGYGFDDYQTVTYFAFKVPDGVSFPPAISNKITVGSSDVLYRIAYPEPYKRVNTEFYERWREVYKTPIADRTLGSKR